MRSSFHIVNLRVCLVYFDASKTWQEITHAHKAEIAFNI
jgi:hypothetical protein